jgi:hypothetical protein
VPSFWTPHAGGLATNITGSIACRNRRVSDAYRACALYFGPGTPTRPCSYSASWLPCNGPPLKREVTPTLVAARLTAATSVQVSCIISRNFCPAQLNSTIEDPHLTCPCYHSIDHCPKLPNSPKFEVFFLSQPCHERSLSSSALTTPEARMNSGAVIKTSRMSPNS